ncbi:predicted protein [Histoplasma capsulatum var. duboisii H88]|uniref:Predicted protein n=1 Tax=Ajellomyces capsulatus (strain H88) TaxID=544711 RepID=F0UNH4_AJEC8|nr:predicted protein [Histoplasma capsulatum var. duboisii H88]QSS52956.1 hypothetical protein I7I53_00050 [Histoplasma capsulatum var. duboisii H88]
MIETPKPTAKGPKRKFNSRQQLLSSARFLVTTTRKGIFIRVPMMMMMMMKSTEYVSRKIEKSPLLEHGYRFLQEEGRLDSPDGHGDLHLNYWEGIQAIVIIGAFWSIRPKLRVGPSVLPVRSMS